MKYVAVLAVAALAAAAVADEPKEKLYCFDKADAGKVPANWKAEKTGKDDGSVWKVAEIIPGMGSYFPPAHGPQIGGSGAVTVSGS